MAHAWSNRSRENGGVASYLGEDKEYLVRYAKHKILEEPNINYFVFGHRHILLNLPIAERTNVVILGDWISLFSYAEYDGVTLYLKQWEE
jgi:UDP-2,3-diacylglucosamine hydrolase